MTFVCGVFAMIAPYNPLPVVERNVGPQRLADLLPELLAVYGEEKPRAPATFERGGSRPVFVPAIDVPEFDAARMA
jgi:hypothetical protein